MTRKEMYEAIKADEHLKIKANDRAARIYGTRGVNFTNLPTQELLSILGTVKPKGKPANNQECIDKGARRAIMAVAKAFGLKNIDKNF